MKSILFLLFICLGIFANSQIVINEGCNKNYLSSLDENGDASDWIELFNAGTNAINLNGYALSDKLTVPNMWICQTLRFPLVDFSKSFVVKKTALDPHLFNLVFPSKTFLHRWDGVIMCWFHHFIGMAPLTLSSMSAPIIMHSTPKIRFSSKQPLHTFLRLEVS